MSLGLTFLAACADAHSVSAAFFRKLEADFFTDAELPYYEFARGYIASFGGFPPREAFAQASLTLANYTSDQVPAALAARVRDRYAYQHAKAEYDNLGAALRGKDIAETERIMRSVLASIGKATAAGSAAVTLADCASKVIEMSTATRSAVGFQGASLGWDYLDAETGGLSGGEFGFVVGRPGVGKSWIMILIALANWSLGKRVAFVSMEMGVHQIARRMLGLVSGVNPNRIRDGTMDVFQEVRVREAGAEMFNDADRMQLIPGYSASTPAKLNAYLDDIAPDVVLVDALYLQNPSRKGDRRPWESLNDIIGETKEIALTRDIPIVGSMQLNREAVGKKVDLKNIAGSDGVGQVGSVVISVEAFPPPHEVARKKLTLLKTREGGAGAMGIEITYDPILHVAEVPIGEDGDESQTGSNDWML